MAKNKYRANATDIWKRPLTVRYIWYAEVDGKPYSGTTWNSLSQAVERGKLDKVKICDIASDKIHTINPENNYEELTQFMDLWRDNYYNVEWEYSPEI